MWSCNHAIRAAGAFDEPHAWYGGLEGAMMPRYLACGYWIGWLQDHMTTADKAGEDVEYANYKLHHCGFTQPTFTGSFEEWLVL